MKRWLIFVCFLILFIATPLKFAYARVVYMIPDTTIKTIKALEGKNVTAPAHNSYGQNINSCNTCHVAISDDENMLPGVNYQTEACISCHDGTTEVYNVINGRVVLKSDEEVTFSEGLDKVPIFASNAGRFSGYLNIKKYNSSMHDVRSSLKDSAAPGGNRLANDSGGWTANFGCSSCHSPHASYSDRLLNPNANNMGTRDEKKGGIALLNRKIINYNQIPIKEVGQHIVVRATKKQHIMRSKSDWVDEGYFAEDVKGPVIMVYKWTGTRYIPSRNPWLNTYQYDSNFSRAYDTNFRIVKKSNSSKNRYDEMNDNLVLYYGKGYMFAANSDGDKIINSLKVANIARAYNVRFDLIEVAQTIDNIPIYVSNNGAMVGGKLDKNGTRLKIGVSSSKGDGVSLSKFCSSCHTDYLAKSGKKTGTYSLYYRHTTITDQFSCFRCHYSHGSDEMMMRDAKERSYSDLLKIYKGNKTKAFSKIQDVNPSSALKRFTNMTVCFACHTEKLNETIINNPYAPHYPEGLDLDLKSWSEGNRWGVQKRLGQN